MNTNKLLHNFERMLSRFSIEDLASALSSYETNSQYGGPTASDLEQMLTEPTRFCSRLDYKAWFEINSPYFSDKCDEIGSVFSDSRHCSYSSILPKDFKQQNIKNPQSEFAGFLFRLAA